jgi:hypothetical protein
VAAAQELLVILLEAGDVLKLVLAAPEEVERLQEKLVTTDLIQMVVALLALMDMQLL